MMLRNNIENGFASRVVRSRIGTIRGSKRIMVEVRVQKPKANKKIAGSWVKIYSPIFKARGSNLIRPCLLKRLKSNIGPEVIRTVLTTRFTTKEILDILLRPSITTAS
jgi:hypothetical protein